MTHEEMAQVLDVIVVELREKSELAYGCGRTGHSEVYTSRADACEAGAAALRALEWRPINQKNDDYEGPEGSFLVGRLLPDGRPVWGIDCRQDTAYKRGFRFMAELPAPPKEGA
jgi:hypothetical protein